MHDVARRDRLGTAIHNRWHDFGAGDQRSQTVEVLDAVLNDDDLRTRAIERAQPVLRSFGLMGFGGEQHPLGRGHLRGIDRDAWT